MAQVYVKYNPYRLSTWIEVNGREIETDSTLYKLVKGKRLQEWIGEFPEMLTKELNTVDFGIEFCGMDLDWDDFEDAFPNAKKIGTVKTADLKYVEGQAAEEKVVVEHVLLTNHGVDRAIAVEPHWVSSGARRRSAPWRPRRSPLPRPGWCGRWGRGRRPSWPPDSPASPWRRREPRSRSQ